MNMMKRGLIALSVVAAVGGATSGLLVSQASATSTRGREVIHTVQYRVGDGQGVGPWTGRGPISSNRGNITDLPSLTTDPTGSSRTILIDPAGSFTTLNTGGTFVPGRSNQFTCFFSGIIRGLSAHIVSGTGAYSKATGNLNVTLSISGFNPRLPNGQCNGNADNSAFETDTALAVGRVNLHTS
jgi:hypothetical protein